MAAGRPGSAGPRGAATGGGRDAGQSIGLAAAISIGVGGMIGAGIFSILGVVAGVAGSGLTVSFAIGGVVALLAAYSYVKLGVRYPSVGGAVTFLVQGYGDGVRAGTLNIFQYVSYIVCIALYAHGFAAYAVTFVHIDARVFAVGVVLVFTLINFVGSRAMGRAETIIVAIKVAILLLFIGSAIVALKDPSRLSPISWPPVTSILFGAGVLFVGYEGFGLISNASSNMPDPARELPRAVYWSIGIVIAIYVLVGAAVTVNLPLVVLKGLGDSALAVAAKPALGQLGFTLVAIAALLSTASAVNATLFGATNVSYQIAKNGGLPAAFDRRLWGRDVEGLFITSGIVIVFVLMLPLAAVAMMGSAGFLLVYAAVGYGHLRIRHETGARASLILASLVTCLGLFALLMVYIVRTQPATAIALAGTLLGSLFVELVYRRVTGRTLARLLADSEALAARLGLDQGRRGAPGRGAAGPR